MTLKMSGSNLFGQLCHFFVYHIVNKGANSRNILNQN